MTHSTDDRLAALHAAFAALTHALTTSEALDTLTFERSAALARSWLGRSGVGPAALPAFDDLVHSVVGASDWGHPPL